MKFILGKKEFTLMIIPGANKRIVRIKLPQSTFIIVPAVLVLILIGFVITLYVMDDSFHEQTDSLQQSHNRNEQQLNERIAVQKTELKQLQGELLDFAEQTDQFKAKLAEIQKLKTVISLMTDASASKATISSDPDTWTPKPDVGGADEPVTDEELAMMLTDTKTDLSGLVHDINELLATLTDSEAKLQEAQRLRAITPTIWPADSRLINSGFGVRKDPFNLRATMHTGLDIDGQTGDNVYAAADGVVVETGTHPEYGNYVRIDHSRGIETQYMHMSKIRTQKGAKVKKGELIGLIGSTGRSTGPHLHYEVIKNNVKINPTPYLISSRKELQ